MPDKLSMRERQKIDRLVRYYTRQRYLCESFVSALNQLFISSPELMGQIHSMKYRVKDPEHMRRKLRKKVIEARESGARFEITEDNFFEKINDGAGYRLLHLHTRQVKKINAVLRRLFEENHYPIIELPKAKTFDDEFRDYFQSIGVTPVTSKSLYTSVHWVIGLNSKAKCTCEIQIRTLAEELWGEVDHALNYPSKHFDVACREQLRALAKATSSCTRLVDAIYRSDDSAKARRRRALGRRT